MDKIKKLDKTFFILLLIQIFIIFGLGFIDINETIKLISFMGIVVTMGVWYILTLKNKPSGK